MDRGRPLCGGRGTKHRNPNACAICDKPAAGHENPIPDPFPFGYAAANPDAYPLKHTRANLNSLPVSNTIANRYKVANSHTCFAIVILPSGSQQSDVSRKAKYYISSRNLLHRLT
jgi:hypothetical protein